MIRSQRIPSALTKKSWDILQNSWEHYAKTLTKLPEIPPRPFDVLYDISHVESLKQVHDNIIQVYSRAESFTASFAVDVIPVVPTGDTTKTQCQAYVPSKNADLSRLFSSRIDPALKRSENITDLMSDRILPCCQFDCVAVGGTFDRLHSGHKVLLTIAALCASKRLIIGITSDDMVRGKQYSSLIEAMETRERAVLKFLAKIRPDLDISINRIEDPAGGIHLNPWLRALVLSSETLENGKRINVLRKDNGLNPLQLICIQLVHGTSGRESRISSTLLRSKSM
mmetsp:Transcript_11186/g.16917  ORF Transcript_11186/g.16917 Transcript_11186/m.16917 type:complete len:283 (-) Transcript_11186:9-857(-)